MEQIVKISKSAGGRQVVSGRELYSFLTNDKECRHFNEWAKRNISENSFAIYNSDYQRIPYDGGNGRQMDDYAITIDFAKRLSMMSKTEKGEAARRYFIEMEQAVISQAPVHRIPQTLSQALRLAADQAEMIEAQQEQLNIQEKELTVARPAVEFTKVVEADEQTYDITYFAKLIGMHPHKLFEWLRRNGIIRQYDNAPMQYVIDQGYFVLKSSTYRKNGHAESYVSNQARITGKGQTWLFNKLKSAGEIKSPENYLQLQMIAGTQTQLQLSQ